MKKRILRRSRQEKGSRSKGENEGVSNKRNEKESQEPWSQGLSNDAGANDMDVTTVKKKFRRLAARKPEGKVLVTSQSEG